VTQADPVSGTGTPVPLADRLKAAAQHLLPKRALSSLMYRLTRIAWAPWKDRQIDWFVRHYGVDMDIAELPDAADYTDFNHFFTRALKPGARPLPEPPDAVACPVDGTLADLGTVSAGRMLQAKRHDFSLQALLGSDADFAARLEGGHFVTLYLSPRDYHRIHMPLAGELARTVHIPGDRFAVNDYTARAVPGLYARNERVAALFETAAGPMALVLVGALNVGSIDTAWPRGEWLAPGEADPRTAAQRSLQRGEEMGRFNMGSTVIAVFAPGRVELAATLAEGQAVQMGQIIGTITP